MSFVGKKQLEKHRKTPEHKVNEKKYSKDHAKQAAMNADENLHFVTTFKMACPECGCNFETEEQFIAHGNAEHNGVQFKDMSEHCQKRSVVCWRIHFFPLFDSVQYAEAAEGCKIACKVVLKTKDEICTHFFTNHSILNYCDKCEILLPCDIMQYHKRFNCDNIEAIKQMDIDDKANGTTAKEVQQK